ncbi:MAG: hypothetical protein ABI683_09245 [Ginsengibacter sp.]
MKANFTKMNTIDTIGTAALAATFLTIVLLFTWFSNGNYVAHFF